MQKSPSGTESQKDRKRQLAESNPMWSSTGRKLPIEDFPETLKVVDGGLTNELQTWLNTRILGTVRQWEEASLGAIRGDGNVRILLNAIDECKPKSTTVSHNGEEKLQLRTEANDRERCLTQRYDFCEQACGGDLLSRF